MIELSLPIIALIAGFILLMKSADLLVDNASELALRLGISTFLVGILVIGFGTSAPEMFVSAVASLQNKGNLALGNALGSNITNIGLVLGAAACVSTIAIRRESVIADMPLLLITGALAAYFVMDGHLSNLDGWILLTVLAVYLYWSATQGKSGHDDETQDIPRLESSTTSKLITMCVASIALLIIASRLLVYGAVSIASAFGVSDLVIGLTVVAIGTSLPELAAAIAAAKKNVHDMIIGNIIGSNIFNMLGVLGITGAVQTTLIETNALWRDFPIMLGLTVLLMVIGFARGRIARLEGILFLGLYLSYVAYLVMSTSS